MKECYFFGLIYEPSHLKIGRVFSQSYEKGR